MKQTESGKAFEYQLATEFAKFLNIPFTDSPEKTIGAKCYDLCDTKERAKIQRAADEASIFIRCHDDRFKNAVSVLLQPDKAGKTGDVRDLVITLKNKSEIGISCKNRHDAIKHSRLSDTIDFGKEWTDYPCSSTYMKKIQPLFTDLRERRKKHELFRDIPDKANRYYLPLLMCFEDELRRLCEDFGQRFVKRMFQYLLGTHDFYKVIKENGHVAIHSFNMSGQLEWGWKWKIPDRIESITRKRGSTNTLIVSFVGGWQLSFRIHNASSRIEPSFKFDIKFIGLPQNVARNVIEIKPV
jgi:hypothetical protein